MTDIEKINPLQYITDWSPVPEQALNASGWFLTEHAQVVVEDNIDGVSISWFLAQGWVVVSASRTDPWYSLTDGRLLRVGFTTYSIKRRKLQSELVLQSMINEFTKAYNEGRLLNDRRYDEIVALFDVMLDRSEDEISGLTPDMAKYDAIIDGIITGLPTGADAFEAKIDALIDGYGDSRREQINLRFDNEIAAAKQSLVARGMFNSTVWGSTSTGIQRSREMALTDLEDKIADRSLNAMDSVQRVKMDLSRRLEDAAARLSELKRGRRFDTTDFRNKILTAMLAFMERREDKYPGIAELAPLSAQLGFAEGSSVSP